MAKRHLPIIILGLIAFLAGTRAQAQDAAFDSGNAYTGGAGQLPGTHPQRSPQPLSTSAASENQSNLKHWSRFSSSAKPMFVRVPAGTKMQSTASHYVRPQWVEPGKAPASKTESQKGPVKRYLAYNIPAGSFTKKQTPGAQLPVLRPATAKKSSTRPALMHVLSYGSKTGEITKTAVPAHRHPHTYVSCYARYQ